MARETNTIPFEHVTLNRSGSVIHRASAQASGFLEDLGQENLLQMISIPKGFFQMGSHDEGGYPDELPIHPMFLKEFSISQFPITQAQWQVVMGRAPDCRFHGPDLPVENISWKEAVLFCERLSRRVNRQYTLPSESQWEYACRASTSTPFSTGDTITTDYANYVGDFVYRLAQCGIYRHQTTPQGTFLPNPWGLYDMHGNVWEYCQDAWSETYAGAPIDGSARPGYYSSRSKETAFRVCRGGSWHEPPAHCRSATRLKVAEDERLEYYGFRVVCPD
jgi:formylglycine-generating enzyme required for sulfatase activity